MYRLICTYLSNYFETSSLMNADRKFSTCRVKISGNIGRGAVCRVEKSRFTVLFYSEVTGATIWYSAFLYNHADVSQRETKKKKKKEGEIKPVGTFETNNQNKSRQKKNGRKKEKRNDRPDENATNRSTISLN